MKQFLEDTKQSQPARPLSNQANDYNPVEIKEIIITIYLANFSYI